MTDSNNVPNPSSTGPPDYEGTDPDLPDRKNEGSKPAVSTVQVGASAAAAVTSALAASFFGVAGTLIGAAVGSIVSTIAGALYSHYLGQAGARIKVTKDVVIQRIPGEVLATTPLRHLTGPSDLPGRQSLQPIRDESNEEIVALPVEEANRLLQQPDGMAPLNQTSGLLADGSRTASTPRPWWKKPAIAMAAVSAAGFLIALVVVLTTETVIGHPVSGGDSGNTFTKIGSSDTTKTKVTPTQTPTEAPSAPTTEAPGEATTDAPDPTATSDPDPTATSDPDPNATDQPSPEATGTGAAATDSGAQGLEATPIP